MITSAIEPERALLRHTVATLAYRAGKAIRGVPEGFSAFAVGDPPKTPGRILAHLGDLIDWALTMCDGPPVWRDTSPRSWAEDAARFHEALARLDARLTAGADLATPSAKIFQGPIADALTHVGQIAMLRRLGGVPMRSENYFRAEIVAGRVGAEQTAPRKEFD